MDYTLKVSLNGKLARTYRVTKDNALFFDNRFITGDLFLENGANTLTIEKTGKGNLYWNAYSEYFSLEEPIKASGNELEVSRRFFKLTRKARTEEAKPMRNNADRRAAMASAKVASSCRRPRPIEPEPNPNTRAPKSRTAKP